MIHSYFEAHSSTLIIRGTSDLDSCSGSFQNLALVVSSYKPAVDCYGSIGKATTVHQSLIDQIPTISTYQVFGHIGAPMVEQILPRVFRQAYVPGDASKAGFYVQVDTNDQLLSFDARWFDVWAAAVSINTLCVRNNQAGIAMLQGGLIIKIDRIYKAGSYGESNDGMGRNATNLVQIS